MTCPVCGHQNQPGKRFCVECGAALAQICPSCSSRCEPEEKFCGECGAALRVSGSTFQVPGSTDQQRPVSPDTWPLTPDTSAGTRTPRSYTPKHLAEKILISRAALEGERKQVTVLFADVKGSMELAEQLDPEEWHRVLDRFFQILTEGVHRFEGTVNQYTGDGIMALFGAPVAHEDHAQRACYAALHLRDDLRRYADTLRVELGLNFSVRMGLSSGEVVVGKIGDDLRMDYTAQGHTVGLAARMEQLAEPGRILLTDCTADLVRGFFRVRDLGELKVKGVGRSIRVYDLEGLGELRTRLDASRARGLSKFFGRETELAALDAALERALSGQGQVVGIVADAGVGKSRLCYEFVQRCRAREVQVHQAHGVSYGKMVPFLPVLQLLKSYFRLVEGDGADTARSKIAGTLALVDPQLVRAVPLLLEFMGVADPKSTPLQLDPDARRGQFLDLVHQMIRAESRHRPLVMLVEDLHWIDGGTETFLSVTAEAVAGVRALLLVNFRPEYHAPWMKRSYYQQLPLLPLGPEVTREFIRHLLGNEPSLERLGEFIQSRTGGNPFFIEEMVRVLAEEGKLDGTRGDYRLVEPIETLQLPASVRTILTARIDRLGENEKQVLQTAAVIGKEFSKPILSQVVEAGLKPTPTQEDVAEALGRLEDGEFIHQTSLYPTLGYAFVHPLTQEVAYASQLVERKKTIHTAVARALEVLEQDALEEKAALIAQHWESAGELSEAARWHQRAAAWLSTRSSAEALAHYRRVREILLSPKVPADHALVFEAASQILYLGSFEGLDSGEARSCFGWAKQSCEENGNRAGLAVLLARSAFFLGGIGEMGECLKYLAESISLADQTGYPFVQAGSRAGATYWFLQAGRLREALAAADEGLGILETIGGDPTSVLGDPVVVMQNFRGWTLRWMGRLEEAQRTLERTKERAETRGDLTMLEIAHAGLAQVGEALGRLDMLRFHARQCLDLGMQLKSPRMRNLGLLMWGRSLLLDGQAEEAVQQFEEVCSVLETRGVTREVEAVNLGALALAQARCGRIAEARDTARRAVEAGAHNGTLAFQAYALCEQAAVLLLDMDSSTKDVANALDMASELIEQTGSAFLMPYVHRLRAQLAERTGDGETWRRELERAVRLLREMGASAAAEDVAKELRLETRA